MVKQPVVGGVYRLKLTGEKLIFRTYLEGSPFPYCFMKKEGGRSIYLTHTELKYIDPDGSAKLIKVDKRIV